MAALPAPDHQGERPLEGVRVIDLALVAMAATGRLLAELGAEVIRVEPPGGSSDRKAGRLVDGVSLDFVAANLGKRVVTLDLDREADRASFERLLDSADILIENTRPASPQAERLDVAALHARHPALVILSISDFGQANRYSTWQGTDPVFHALSGELSRSGIPGRAPLLPPGNLVESCAAPQAAFVTLVAYYNRLETGHGDHLDFSMLDAATQALDPGYGIAGSATAGVPASKLPRGRPDARAQYPIIPCADGFVRLCVLAPRQWQGMFEWMGRPEEFADPSYSKLQTRFTSPTLLPAIARFFADKSRAELEQAGQRHGVPTAAVLSLEEALVTEQIRARNCFKTLEIAPGRLAPFPDGTLEIDGRRAGIRSQAPASGDFGAAIENQPAAAGKVTKGPNHRPLAGLRVLDLGVIVVGAEQGRLLADQGADVVKVENAAFPDGSRQTRDGSPLSVTFAAGHRNKRGLALNLRDPKGKALFLRLIEQSDILLSNFKPGTLESLGLDAATLRASNPRLIALDSSAFGPTGPWSRRLGYGPLVRASAGLSAAWSYPGEPGSFSDAITVYPDHVAARIGIVGVLALLIRRKRTGSGGTVSVSQAEVMLSHMASEIAYRSLSGSEPNFESLDAPWGVFPCAGDDEWCVVSVRDATDWRNLCRVMQRPDLAADTALADRAGRNAARGRIDAAVTEWTRSLEPRHIMESLQAAGVPGAAMLRVAELPEFPYFRERQLFRLVHHPAIAQAFHLETAPVQAESLPVPPERPAPRMGEHSVEIMREWLGLPDATITALQAENVIEMPPGGE